MVQLSNISKLRDGELIASRLFLGALDDFQQLKVSVAANTGSPQIYQFTLCHRLPLQNCIFPLYLIVRSIVTGAVSINGVEVVVADALDAANGVVHAMDAVLPLPRPLDEAIQTVAPLLSTLIKAVNHVTLPYVQSPVP